MENLKNEIEKILNQFAQEEMGNRLSQFAFVALKDIILNAILSYKFKEKGEINELPNSKNKDKS